MVVYNGNLFSSRDSGYLGSSQICDAATFSSGLFQKQTFCDFGKIHVLHPKKPLGQKIRSKISQKSLPHICMLDYF